MNHRHVAVLAGGIALAAILTGVVIAVRDPGPGATPPPAAAPGTSGPACPPAGNGDREVAGAVIDAGVGTGGALDRRDAGAVDGPWTVVIRRSDGALGRHGAVVTYPVDRPPGGREVAVGAVTGHAVDNAVSWPLAGAYARIRGDLTEAELVALAAATTVAGGRPAVAPAAGFVVASTGPYRSPFVREARYSSAELGERAALGGGLAYTGVVTGGGFEDQLFARRGSDGGTVHCVPSVVSSVFGGNATLAWEPAPGTVAYVGYSGSERNDDAVAALRRLADRTRLLDPAAWQTLGPQTVDQSNDPG
jgi:hypothetical protein